MMQKKEENQTKSPRIVLDGLAEHMFTWIPDMTSRATELEQANLEINKPLSLQPGTHPTPSRGQLEAESSSQKEKSRSNAHPRGIPPSLASADAAHQTPMLMSMPMPKNMHPVPSRPNLQSVQRA
jgi:hypothetical protein